MRKQQAIEKANEYIGQRILDGRNTSFSNVNVSKPVWWLNINPDRFKRDLHLLLTDDSRDSLTWLTIEPNSISSPENTFRILGDNGAVDLAISCLPRLI